MRGKALVSGKIVSFVSKKKFGFIKGDDGEDYFFHISFLNDKSVESKLVKGVRVEFDPTPAKKGLEARRLVVHTAITGKRLKKFIQTKNAAPKDGVIERKIHLKTKPFKNPDEGRAHLKMLAKQMGANALLNQSYEKATASEGNYRYSVHSFSADVAVVSEVGSFDNDVYRKISQERLDEKIKCFDELSEDIVNNEKRYSSVFDPSGIVFVVVMAVVMLAVFAS